jgi:plasmid stabilization system protein ParE
MVEIVFTNGAVEDIYRLTYFLLETYPEVAMDTGEIIIDGLQVLATHPLVGVRNEDGLRRLVISRGRSGYIAIYDYDQLIERVLVVAVKHQRENEFN